MKVIARPKAGTGSPEDDVVRLEKPLDMALLTIIPKGGGSFSIRLPAVDWEEGLQAIYSFNYNGKVSAGEATLPAAMQVVPVIQDIESHCMDATDGKVTEDCIVCFEKGRSIDVASDVFVQLSKDEIGRLNTFLERWNKR